MKICPLREMGNKSNKEEHITCLKYDCAWWIPYSEDPDVEGSCAIADIAYAIENVARAIP